MKDKAKAKLDYSLTLELEGEDVIKFHQGKIKASPREHSFEVDVSRDTAEKIIDLLQDWLDDDTVKD